MNEVITKRQTWILASRPQTLWAAICPVMIGLTLAVQNGYFHLWSAVATLAAALLIQIGTNFTNDYFDFVRGTDNETRLGPLRVMQAGLVRKEEMIKAIRLVYGLSLIIALFLSYRAGWPILALGIVSVIIGYMYTGGPFPLGYNGLGDIFAFIFFGPVAVAGTHYIQSLHLDGDAVLAGIITGLFSVAILTVNNLRDLEGDRQSGKKTLAVRFGATFSKIEFIGSFVGIALMTVVLAYFRDEGSAAPIVALIACVLAIPLMRHVLAANNPRALNYTLMRTGQLLLVHSVLFSLGWLF